MINFELLTGITAKDYSELVKKENLKPVELSLQKLEDMMSYIIHEFEEIMSLEQKNLTLNDYLSYKIIIFTILTLCFIGFASFLEVIYVKRYFKNKKLI
jgi:hypothetical protein